MHPLSKLQNAIYAAGGILLVVGIILHTVPGMEQTAPYVYTVGAAAYASMQMLARYDGRNLVIRRLRRQQLFGAILLLLAAPLMFMDVWNVSPLPGGTWLLLVTIAAIYQLYAAFRIPAELKKENTRK